MNSEVHVLKGFGGTLPGNWEQRGGPSDASHVVKGEQASNACDSHCNLKYVYHRQQAHTPKAAEGGVHISESAACLCHAHGLIFPSTPASPVYPPLSRQRSLEQPVSSNCQGQ